MNVECVILIVEIGLNYDGDFDFVKCYIEVSVKVGVDIVKFQSLSWDGLIV